VLSPIGAAAVTTVTIPPSIDASGRSDVSNALNAFFSQVPAGADVVFPAGGHFRVEGVLLLTNLRDVTIDGNGSEIIARTNGSAIPAPAKRYRAHWPRLREHVSIRRATNLSIRNLSVIGPNTGGRYDPALEGQAGFAVYASSNVTLTNVSVRQVYGDGVYIASASNLVNVAQSTIDTVGRQGISVVFASHVVLDHDHFANIARSVVDLEPAARRWSVTDVHVLSADVGNYGNFLLAAGGAGPSVSSVWIQQTHVTGGNGLAIAAGNPRQQRRDLHIIDNTSDVAGKVVQTSSPSTAVIQLTNLDGVEIVGNKQRVDGGAVAVSLDRVCGLTFKDNQFQGASAESQIVAACGAAAPARRNGSGAKTANGNGRAARRKKSGDTSAAWIVAAVVVGLGMALILVFLNIMGRRGGLGEDEPAPTETDELSDTSPRA
jgi:hypothetical protein